MDTLPAEILNRIWSCFSIEELEVIISKVSKRWAGTAKTAIHFRVAKIDRIIPREARLECDIMFGCAKSSPVELLKKYEAVTFRKEFRLIKFNPDQRINSGIFVNFMISYAQDKGIDPQVLDTSVKFVPMFQLVLFMVRNELFFMHEKALFPAGMDEDSSLLPERIRRHQPNLLHYIRERYGYKIDPSNTFWPYTDSIIVTMIDACRDHIILCSSNLRYPCLYQIVGVSHPLRLVFLRLVRRIFFPITISALQLYQEKVVAVFSTGDVGIWQKTEQRSEAELRFSRTRISGIPADARMFRIGNFFIIKSSANIYNSVEATTATEGFEIASVPLLDILPKMSVVDGKYKDVDMMQIIGNLLLVQVQVDKNDKYMKILCVLKLRRQPLVQDFTAPHRFQELLILNESKFYNVSLGGGFLLIPPSSVPGHAKNFIKSTLLAIPFLGGVEAAVLDLIDSHVNFGKKYVSVDAIPFFTQPLFFT